MEDEAVDPTQARGSTAIRHSPGHAAEGSPEMDAPNDDSGPENSTAAAEWMAVELPTVEENLALDEALLEEAHEGLTAVPVVRTWMAEAPVVVVGSSSRIADEVDEAACGDLGVRIVRRPSGGLTVLLGPGCLMWSVVVPHPSGSPPIEQIHASMLEPLRGQLNRAVADGGRSVERRGSSDLVLVAGPARKKCSGNALRVRRHAALYHGTLLDSFDIPLISRVLRHPPREPDYRARRPHGEFLANLGLGRSRLETLVREAFAAASVRSLYPLERVTRLVRDRYSDAAWTRRL